MGSEQQETKNLPRNRKCGNCRFFEPAPLWRKGWCRNPKLYPPHANHLVDSNTIDCEGGFRSRIYWEPLPIASSSGQPTPPMGTAPVIPRIFRTGAGAADSSEQVSPEGTTLGVLRPGKVPNNIHPTPVAKEEVVYTQAEPEPEMVLVEEEPTEVDPAELERLRLEAEEAKQKAEQEKIQATAAFLGIKDWRAELRRVAPFAEKWPLEKVYPKEVLPWVLAGLLVIVMLFVVFGGKGKDVTVADNNSVPAATQTALYAINSTTYLTPPVTTAGAALTVTPTTSPLKGKAATITGLGNGEILRLRAQPSISSDILDKLKDGDKIKIVDGPIDADKLEWYKIEANGKVGWVVKKYVVIQS